MRLSVLMLVPVLALADLSAGSGDSAATAYTRYSKGLRVGAVRTVRSREALDGREVSRCEVTTHVHVNLLILRHDLDAHEVYVSDGSGPVEYRHTRTEGGRTSDVTGVRADGSFHFVITEGGSVRTNEIRDADYDAVSMDGPELALAAPGEKKTLRILDMGSAEIVERTYHWIRNDGDYRVVDFTDKHKSVRRWVRADALGMLIARQDGRDKAGTYSMRMTNGQ